MAEDWLADVRKYAADADEKVVGAIVRHCGIALRNRDSSLVSFTDKKETDRVRQNFLKKKLGLTQSDEELDAAIASVGERMKADRTRNRVTVYYLLTDHYGLLAVFGGAAATATAAAAAIPARGAGPDGAAAPDVPVAPPGSDAAPAPVRPLGAAGLPQDAGPPAAGGGAAAPLAAAGVAGATGAPARAAPGSRVWRESARDGKGSDGAGAYTSLDWLWLALAFVVLALFALLIVLRRDAPGPVRTPSAAVAAPAAPAPAAPAPAVAEAAAPAPPGAAAIAGERDGEPMVSVYFETGRADVHPDFATATAPVVAYLGDNPEARLAVSGFNDSTGNAALNARLSRDRAVAVSQALQQLGVPAASIDLVRPENTTDASLDAAQARRVEITVR